MENGEKKQIDKETSSSKPSIFWVPCSCSRVYIAIHYQLFEQVCWIVVSVSLVFVGVVMDFWTVSCRPIIVDVFRSYSPHCSGFDAYSIQQMALFKVRKELSLNTSHGIYWTTLSLCGCSPLFALAPLPPLFLPIISPCKYNFTSFLCPTGEGKLPLCGPNILDISITGISLKLAPVGN